MIFYFTINAVFLLLTYQLAIASNTINIIQPRKHILQIGFNLGYPDRVIQQKKALEIISKLGVNNVRIFEIFNGKEGDHYKYRLKKALDIILSYNLTPLITISNNHADLRPSNEEILALSSRLSKDVRAKTKNISRYSNRFPPLNLSEYQAKLDELINFLFDNFGEKNVTQWFFEIGNEPDADLYFWGTSEQFHLMTESVINIFKKNGVNNIGGFGVTQHSIFSDETIHNRNISYRDLTKNIKNNLNYAYISFHLYARKFEDSANGPLSHLPEWLTNLDLPIFITEWNVSSDPNIAFNVLNSKHNWGNAFINQIVDCYKKKIDRLYIFKLRDSSIGNVKQLGAFTVNDTPKEWFNAFSDIWSIIKQGYYIEYMNEDLLRIYDTSGNRFIVVHKYPQSTSYYIGSNSHK